MSEFESVERYLPESVKEIVQVIGLPAAEKLVKTLGGFSFQFSEKSAYAEKLREILGQEDADKLQKYMGKSEVYLPRCETALRMLRNQRIYDEFVELTTNGKLSGRRAIMQLCPKYAVCDRIAWDAVRYFQSRRAREAQKTLF